MLLCMPEYACEDVESVCVQRIFFPVKRHDEIDVYLAVQLSKEFVVFRSAANPLSIATNCN